MVLRYVSSFPVEFDLYLRKRQKKRHVPGRKIANEVHIHLNYLQDIFHGPIGNFVGWISTVLTLSLRWLQCSGASEERAGFRVLLSVM